MDRESVGTEESRLRSIVRRGWRNRLAWEILLPVGAVAMALLAGAAVIVMSGISPVSAYAGLWRGSLASSSAVAETLVKVTPLALAGLGSAIAFRAGVFNIGAEGQLYFGAIGAAFVGLFLGEIPPLLGIPLALGAGVACGAAWSGIAGFLKLRFGANEIIVTLMQNYIAIALTTFLVNGPWRDPASTQPFTAQVVSGTQLPILVPGTRLHAGVLLALLAGLVLFWLMRNSVLGLQLNIFGSNPRAAEYAGMSRARLTMVAMLASGGLAGLAGAVEVSGVQHRLLVGLSSGYGYTAIAVAILGQLAPLGVLAASFLFAVLLVGADGMQQYAGVPIPVVQVIEGVVILFVLATEVIGRRWRKRASVGGDLTEHGFD